MYGSSPDKITQWDSNFQIVRSFGGTDFEIRKFSISRGHLFTISSNLEDVIVETWNIGCFQVSNWIRAVDQQYQMSLTSQDVKNLAEKRVEERAHEQQQQLTSESHQQLVRKEEVEILKNQHYLNHRLIMNDGLLYVTGRKGVYLWDRTLQNSYLKQVFS